MDIVIIASLKRLFCQEMLGQVLYSFDTWQTRRDSNQALMASFNSLVEGFDLHLHVVARLVKKSWDAVHVNTIARC